jgi:hypothetical protein
MLTKSAWMLLLAALSASAPRASSQMLDLTPQAQMGTTCFEPLAATFGSSEFDGIARRLLSTPPASDQDAAARLVLALTLAKCDADIPAQRLTRMREVLGDPSAPLSIDTARGALSLLLPRSRTRSAWSQRAFPAAQGPELAQVLLGAGVAEDAVNQAAEASLNPALAFHLVNISRLMQTPPASLSVKAREAYASLTSIALDEASKGRAERLLLASEIGAAKVEIAAIGDARTPALTRAFDRFVLEAANASVGEARARLRATRAVLAMLDAPLPTPQSMNLRQQLVSTFKQLTPELVDSRRSFAPLLPRLLSGEMSIRDPGLLAARQVYTSAVEEFRLLGAINVAVTEEVNGRATVRESHRAAVGRLIDSSKVLGRASARDKVITDHRSMLRIVHAAVTPVPEDVGRPADEQVTRFVERLQRDADELIRSMSAKRKPMDAVLAQNVLLAREIVEFHRSTLLSSSAKEVLWAWPGFEMTQEGLEALTFGLPEQTTGMMRAYLSGRDDRARELLTAGRDRFAGALKLMELARRLEASGAVPNMCLEEVAPGEPDVLTDVGAEHVRAIAILCLGAEELRVLRSAGEETAAAESRINEASRGIVLPPLK